MNDKTENLLNDFEELAHLLRQHEVAAALSSILHGFVLSMQWLHSPTEFVGTIFLDWKVITISLGSEKETSP